MAGHHLKFFVDFLAQKRHDHNFTTSAWMKAVKIFADKGVSLGDEITELKVWSDGGLKTKENLYHFHLLAIQKKVTVRVNFFGPYHGHSQV